MRPRRPGVKKGKPTEFVLKNMQAPGDIMMMSAAVRDLHRTYPGKYRVAVETTAKEVWENNPHLSQELTKKPGVHKVTLGYPMIHRSNQCGLHFIHGFIDDLNHQLGLDVRLSEFRPDMHWSQEEREKPQIPGDYWVIVSGGKADFTAKWWDPMRFQEVVDRLAGRVHFVQLGGGPKAGGATHHHTPLQGVENLVGQTNLRQSFAIILHAKGVITPVTQFMHLAAAVNKPAIVLAGGREHYTWEAYTYETRARNMAYAQRLYSQLPGTRKDWDKWQPPVTDDFIPHAYLHSIGQLDCCKDAGCWRSKVGEGKEHENCKNIVTQPGRVNLPKCMDRITVDEVVRHVEEALAGAPPAPRWEAPPVIEEKKVETIVIPEVPAISLSAASAQAPSTSNATRNVGLTFPVTVCALTYGEHSDLLLRCLSSIYEGMPEDLFHLRVGLNEVPDKTQRRIDDYLKTKSNVEKVYSANPQVFKYPMMRKMFHDPEKPITTDWVMWFDDDSRVTDPAIWLSQLTEIVMEWHPRTCVPDVWNAQKRPTGEEREDCRCPHGVHMFGKVYYFHLRGNQWDWIKQARWYTNRPHKQDRSKKPPMDKIDFCTGGWWLTTMESIRALDWPDPRLMHRGGDIMMGEAMHQQGFGVLQATQGVRPSDAQHRGYNETIAGIK